MLTAIYRFGVPLLAVLAAVVETSGGPTWAVVALFAAAVVALVLTRYALKRTAPRAAAPDRPAPRG